MADIKISELPVVTTVGGTDIFPVVTGGITSQLSIKDLANSIPQVTSSLSASFASNVQLAQTASYVLNAVSASYVVSASYAESASSVVSASYAVSASFVISAATASYFNTTDTGIVSSSTQFNSLTSPFTGSFTGSFVGDGSGLTGVAAGSTFPYIGDAQITGSLQITGSMNTVGTVSVDLSGSSYPIAFSVGTLTKDMTSLSGSTGFGEAYLPVGYQNYYINVNESYNGESSLYLYQVTSDGSALIEPAYTTIITVVNKSTTLPVWIKRNPSDSVVSFRKASAPNTTIPSHSVAVGEYAEFFLDTSNQSVPKWVIYRTGSTY